MMADVARLYIRDGAIVADVTYGRGMFWTKTDHRRFTLLSSDLMTRAQVRADFRRLPYPDESVDVVVLDPPYVHNGHPRMMFNNRYNGAATTAGTSVSDIIELYAAGLREARRVLRRRGRVFVKGMDQVENRQQRWFHLELPAIAEALGMFLRDQFILVPTAPPSFKRWKRQIHARKSHSFLWIFERTPAC
jgi:hypothetical protein